MVKTAFLIIAALLITAVSAPAALEVTFKPAAEVTGDSITIGDIAELSGDPELAAGLADQIVEPAPQPGQAQALDARTIINRLVRQNATLLNVLWQGAATITVSRASVTIDTEAILATIDDYLKDNRHRLPQADIRFVPESPPLPINLPAGEISWQVIPSSPSIIGSSRITLIYSVDNRVRKNFSITGRIEAVAPVVIATKTLKYDELISADAVSVEPRDLGQINNPTGVTELVVGSIVKRTIPSGSAIDTSAIEQPPVVRKGELVKIYITHKRMVLTATGIAKADGRKDEIIRVQNSSSNKLIYCRVDAPGVVEVTL
ncbi:MAG: flagellar basal body P-ring formation protein FlgA [Desulfofustis sp.]|nr:flagellar basal body P-ring formation protein FlgA [Desulfofustis sp.]